MVDQENEFKLLGKDEIDIYYSISYKIKDDKISEDKIYTEIYFKIVISK